MVVRAITYVSLTAMVALAASRAQADVFNMPAGQTSLVTVPVGDAGNASDPGMGIGGVPYDYQIGEYDITAAQYCQFLNDVAATSDPYGLWNSGMGTDASGGIDSSGSAGAYTYTVKTGHANNPAIYVTYYDALRFANWLTNGQGSGATETGSYTITGTGPNWTVSTPSAAQRATWATSYGQHWVVPDANELYKSDFYMSGGTNSGYWDYGTQSDTAPTSQGPSGTPNTANVYGTAGFALTQTYVHDPAQNYLTDVGAYYNTPGPYGTYDVEGPVTQWSDDNMAPITNGDCFTFGGSWYYSGNYFMGSGNYIERPADTPLCDTGFRLACIGLGNSPGDANGDGQVDINDLTIVLSNFGGTGCTWSQGCMDGDPTGTVDVNDLTIVLANFGTTYAASSDIKAVPEPCALVLLVAGLLACRLTPGRKRK